MNARSGNHKSGPGRHDVLIPAAIIIQRALTHFLIDFLPTQTDTHIPSHQWGQVPGSESNQGTCRY